MTHTSLPWGVSLVCAAALAWFPAPQAAAQDIPGALTVITEQFDTLNDASKALAAAACDAPDFRARYDAAFDAFVAVSHVGFGPTQTDDRFFALGFWPDTRGVTQKQLMALIAARDTIADDPERFAKSSIAGRGFYALDWLIVANDGDADYRCALTHAITADIARMTADLVAEWPDHRAEMLSGAGAYTGEDDALRALYTALTTGLQFTAEARLGRPLGTFDRPRPRRAEARRTGRSLRNVAQSLVGLEALAATLSDGDAEVAAAFAEARDLAGGLADDPVFAGVATPGGRFRVEVLQQSVARIRVMIQQGLGPQLGITEGFNRLDGD
ncbi:MAG: imelysin family protein [Pseudomonadota bacterium]